MKNYQITGLMLFIGIWMFIVGAWGGTYLSKDDKIKIYDQGYIEGYHDCQNGYLIKIPEIGNIDPFIKNKKRNKDLKLKFRG